MRSRLKSPSTARLWFHAYPFRAHLAISDSGSPRPLFVGLPRNLDSTGKPRYRVTSPMGQTPGWRSLESSVSQLLWPSRQSQRPRRNILRCRLSVPEAQRAACEGKTSRPTGATSAFDYLR
jgi:hypothetical protein